MKASFPIRCASSACFGALFALAVAVPSAFASGGAGDWFSVTFAGNAVGDPLANDEGVTGGAWALPLAEGVVATNGVIGSEHVLGFETEVLPDSTGLKFTAVSSATKDSWTIDTRETFSGEETMPEMPSNAKAGFTVYAPEGGVASFIGWTKSGWLRLSHDTVAPAVQTWYDRRVAFETYDGVLYVSYLVKNADGEYVVLASASGQTTFRAAGSGVTCQNVAFVGVGTIGDFSASKDEVDPDRVFYWIGADGAKWFDVANWSHTSGGAAAYAIPGSNDVVYLSGQTGAINLGGRSVTVRSFSGSGSYTNGYVRAENGKIVQRGGALTLAAVPGMTYVLSKQGQQLTLTGGATERVSVVIPENWYVEGSSAPVLYFEGEVDWSSPVAGFRKPNCRRRGYWSYFGLAVVFE